jgi:hypothetical protein
MRHKGPSLPFAVLLVLAALLTPVPRTLADPPVRPAERPTTTVAAPIVRKPSARMEDVRKRVAGVYGKLPLSFEVNRGQTDPAVRFLARGPGYTLRLTPTAMLLSVNAPQRPPGGDLDVLGDSSPATLRMQLIGASSAPRIVGGDRLPGRSHYFIGNDPKRWRTDIPQFAQVRYQETYPGIDLVFYGNQEGRLEHDFVVRPGADPRAIQLGFEGVGRIELDGHGDLVLSLTAAGPPSTVNGARRTLRLEKPRLYQETRGRRQEIPGRYVLRGPSTARRVSFDVGRYDRTKPLVIDPVLRYSTYLGGLPSVNAIAVDADGNAYVTGMSNGGCATNGYEPPCTVPAFVNKLSPDGTALIYTSYIGGGGGTVGAGIAVDSQGNAYVTGTTESWDFPATPGAIDTTCDCLWLDWENWIYYTIPDAFVAKLDPTGSTLVYATYLGGAGGEHGRAIAIDGAGNAFVTGDTESADFPTANPLQSSAGGGDAFVAALNSTATALLYSTYLGGTADDWGFGIALDAAANAYVTGQTNSTDFPAVNQIPGALGGGNPGSGEAFLTKLDATGSALVYSSYLGGSGHDTGFAVAVNGSGNAYVTGRTGSTDFPTVAAYQAVAGGSWDAFVTRVSAAGTALDYSTYLGGSRSDHAYGIAVDASGNAYVTGATDSADFPLASPIQGAFTGNPQVTDAFVARLDAAGSGIVYSTYLGGTSYDGGSAVALDPVGNLYVAGFASSGDFPVVPGGYSASRAWPGAGEGFVAKIASGAGVGIAVGPATVAFGNQAVGTTSAVRTARLTAAGSDPLILGVGGPPECPPEGGACDAGWSEGYLFSVTGDFALEIYCPYVLDPGTACTLGVTFTPTAAGTRTGTITIEDNAPGAPHLISLTGIGIAPAPQLILARSNLTFWNQPVGTTSAAQTVTLTNIGSAGLILSSVVASTDFAQTNDCPSPIAAGASCTISVTFTPTATGHVNGTVTITDNAAHSPHRLYLEGVGIGTAPVVGLFPGTLTFAPRPIGTASGPQTVTLANRGNAALTISGVAAGGDFAQTNNCGSSVAAGASCVVNVIFAPTAEGTRTGTVAITDNATGSPHVVSLSGQGTAPRAELSPASAAFGSQRLGTTSAVQLVMLGNRGSAELLISSIVASGDFAVTSSPSNPCGSVLGAGSECGLIVTFTPTALGPRSGWITITDNAADSPRRASLSGTGTQPSVALSPVSLSFGSQRVGTTSAPQTVTLSNTGGASLTVASIVASGNFAQTNTCGGSVGAGATCTVSITFTPSARGTRTGAVTITDDAPGSPHAVSLSGIGTAPLVSLSRDMLTFGTQRVGTTSAAQTVTLSNIGSAALIVSSIVASGDFAQTNTCGSSVAVGASCVITVRFTPIKAGTRTGAVTITDDGPGSPRAIALSGTGRAR